MMNIHEFGKENNEIILLIHPSVVKWDYFENVIPLLQEKYHLLIPALPGYDFENDSDFTSVEQIASELNDWLSTRGYRNLYAVYGCSMGGSIALMVTLEQRIKIKHCIMDGGITPYQLPWFVTRFIALKDVIELFAPSMDDYLYIMDLQKNTFRISQIAVDRFMMSGNSFDDAVNSFQLFVYKGSMSSVGV